ncbi:hypothetical protein [Vibrio parahaemolyticus]|uniref:hypothetical protein n=2 Tax=Vibrio parahaemolyticus TaxID=670 RepID=UPI00226A2CA7|nr:hypothetical protein [Vibrio parahaemolyticus]EIV1640570.1 hypothetical protein [Vibrio parahaemolyticus]MCX8860253.1 hypothetical protein [Vibrio parahaemolyticus]MCX8865411.1 hypothetical protein [Vibrio parahaemolyticus]MCX8870506.1 hypothetical protein [Vibrio parahaemolyticus]MCX8900739.1 hypothetical protein [Vibrio parahaemolyticus]
MSKSSKSQVIDYIWQYSRYYGNQLAFLEHVEENGSASLVYLFNLLENVLKAHIDDYGETFQNVVRKSYESGLLTKVEHDFLNNKKTGVRRLRNVLAHANLSKFNIRFGNEELLYPLTENDNCQLLYQKLSGIIFNIMLKVAALNLTVDISVNVDSEIKALKLSIIEFSPEDILIDKGIDPATLDGWQDLKVSDQYRIAENAQNVKVLTHIFSGLADEWK